MGEKRVVSLQYLLLWLLYRRRTHAIQSLHTQDVTNLDVAPELQSMDSVGLPCTHHVTSSRNILFLSVGLSSALPVVSVLCPL